MLKYLTAGACLFFVAFVIARAVHVALTYDEAAAYIKFISTGVLAVFSFAYSTNHFLYTLLAKLSYLVGGSSDLALRLPSLIGYGMYLCFSILILGLLRYRPVAFAGFLLLNLNTYLLDYFALSRGYGLALGFLMGALFFFFRFLRQLRGGAPPGRDLSRALIMASGAVLANFTLLNLYLSLLAIGLVAVVVANRLSTSPPPDADYPRRSSRHRITPRLLPIVAAVFTALVFSQDAGLSDELYEPILVKLVGPTGAELDQVKVMQFGLRGNRHNLLRQGDEWRSSARADTTLLRIEVPASSPLAAIHLAIGTRAFWHAVSDGTWTRRQTGETLVLENAPSLSLPKSMVPRFREVINWAGEGPYLRHLLARTVSVLVALTLLGVLLKGLGWLAVRVQLLRWDQWAPFSRSVLWMATLAGSPLYLLARNSELYFGGSRGLVQDAVTSLIDSSFYGQRYHDNQTAIVINAAAASFAVFAIILYGSYRRRGALAVLPGVSLMALLGMISFAIVIERHVLHTPYPLGRTALFYIPLYLLLATFCCDALAEWGRFGRVAVACVVAPFLVAAVYHFWNTANVTYTLDWPSDADTKTMMEDVERLAAAAPTKGSTLVEVHWEYWPVASLYAARYGGRAITVVTQPSVAPSDFVYTTSREPVDPAKIIKRYPRSDSVLARTR